MRLPIQKATSKIDVIIFVLYGVVMVLLCGGEVFSAVYCMCFGTLAPHVHNVWMV